MACCNCQPSLFMSLGSKSLRPRRGYVGRKRPVSRALTYLVRLLIGYWRNELNLSLTDWLIIAVSVVALRFASLSTRKYMKGVADFLSANRSAGRYLLTIAGQMGGAGVANIVAGYEVMNSAGLSPGWWGSLYIPAFIVILMTGWVFYRFRETRALTMAQFFEMRYSRNFRINAGILCWISGIVNFGIFPGVAARFFIYYCGLPDYFHIPGVPFAISTYATVMAIDMGLALSFVLMGGQISVMITECLQGMFCTIAFIVIAAAIMIHFSWPQMVHALQLGSKPDASTINPFHTGKVPDFNVWSYLIGVFGAFYTYLSWQCTQGFNSSARSPHEQKMGGIIGSWRGVPQGLAITLLGLASLAVLRLPEFASKAAIINDCLRRIPNETVRGQMMLPVAMAHVLPIGIKGLFGTIMLFISFTCHDTYMHSWGSIFIQDVYMPIKNKALSPEEHIKLLRWSILFVAVFAYFFSLFYPPSEKILMFFAATGSIWLGGSGAVIVGGLYWKRGTTLAACVALNTGAILGFMGIMLPVIWQSRYHKDFWINSQVLWFIAMVTTLVIYVTVSLFTGKTRKMANLNKLLHRGEYADGEHIVDEHKGNKWLKIVGITHEFSKSDKFLAIFLVAWSALSFLWFVAFSIANLLFPVTDAAWATFWHVSVFINVVLSLPCAVWFTVGGTIDIRALFKHLETAVRDERDDGRVVAEPIEESLESALDLDADSILISNTTNRSQ